jgi:hypothetical protein
VRTHSNRVLISVEGSGAAAASRAVRPYTEAAAKLPPQRRDSLATLAAYGAAPPNRPVGALATW